MLKNTVDYGIVSRWHDPNTGAVVITIAGITPYGTQAAGELATDAAMLAPAMRQAPPGWARKNMQIVFRTRVVIAIRVRQLSLRRTSGRGYPLEEIACFSTLAGSISMPKPGRSGRAIRPFTGVSWCFSK